MCICEETVPTWPGTQQRRPSHFMMISLHIRSNIRQDVCVLRTAPIQQPLLPTPFLPCSFKSHRTMTTNQEQTEGKQETEGELQSKVWDLHSAACLRRLVGGDLPQWDFELEREKKGEGRKSKQDKPEVKQLAQQEQPEGITQRYSEPSSYWLFCPLLPIVV